MNNYNNIQLEERDDSLYVDWGVTLHKMETEERKPSSNNMQTGAQRIQKLVHQLEKYKTGTNTIIADLKIPKTNLQLDYNIYYNNKESGILEKGDASRTNNIAKSSIDNFKCDNREIEAMETNEVIIEEKLKKDDEDIFCDDEVKADDDLEDMLEERDVTEAEAKVRQLLTELQLKRDSQRVDKVSSALESGWAEAAREGARRATLAEGGARAAQAAARKLAEQAEQQTNQYQTMIHQLQTKERENTLLHEQVRTLMAEREARARRDVSEHAKHAASEGARRAAHAALQRVHDKQQELNSTQRKLEQMQRKLELELQAAGTLRDQAHEHAERARAREQSTRESLKKATHEVANLAAELGRERAKSAANVTNTM